MECKSHVLRHSACPVHLHTTVRGNGKGRKKKGEQTMSNYFFPVTPSLPITSSARCRQPLSVDQEWLSDLSKRL